MLRLVRIPRVLGMVLAVVLGAAHSAATWAQSDTNNTAEKRAARLAAIGPAIVNNDDLSAHVPGAEITGSDALCPPVNRPGYVLSPEELQEATRRAAIEHQEQMTAISERYLEIYNREYNRPFEELVRQRNAGEISEDEFARRYEDLEQKSIEVGNRQRAEEQAARQAHRESLNQQRGTLLVYIQHEPRDENATIVPLDGHLPTAAHVVELNSLLGPFLQSCKDTDYVYVNHFFRDEFRYGSADPARPVVHYQYSLRDGVLSLSPQGGQYASNILTYGRDASQNPELYLSGFRAKADLARSIAAEYRQSFYSESARVPGIVYRYDEYWRSYGTPYSELPRRIFDGDFKYFRDTVDFRAFFAVFADFFTKRCPSEVVGRPEIYRVPYTEYGGTEYHVDGSSTTTYIRTHLEIPIDRRFTPQWGDYYPAVNENRLRRFGRTVSRGSLDFGSMRDISDFMEGALQIEEEVTPELGILDRFFNQHECSSATVAQMADNFVRAANNRDPVQTDGTRYSGANRESDPPRRN